MKPKQKKQGQCSPIHISARGLQGRQSVRVTLRLPEKVIRLLALAAAQLGVKQKSVFDQLLDDAEVLRQVAGQARGYTPEQRNRRQKTFVISRQSLDVLKKTAQEQGIHRDILVELSIQRLLPLMAAEREKHQEREKLFSELGEWVAVSRKLADRAEEKLGGEDPATVLLGRIAQACEENAEALARLVERGALLDEYGTAGERESGSGEQGE